MNRKRNIILWIITALFFAGAMFLTAVISIGIMLAVAVPTVITVMLLMLLIPSRIGLAKSVIEAEESSEVILPAIFHVELQLESMNLPKVIRIPIDKSEFTIGRSSNCDFAMEENKRLSSRHVTIQFHPEEHSYTIVDNNTTNGTLLNRESLIPGRATAIKRNDILELPGVIFKVRSAYS